MAHYFDDVFHRTVTNGTPHTPGKPRMRRSSTARSVGARSDFDNDRNSLSRTNSVYLDDPERAKAKSEADEHMHRYISDELDRYKTETQSGTYENGEEFEAKP